MDIDLVYTWVNGNDPVWRAKRDALIGKSTTTGENCDGRYADNDELKYSLRSVEKYAPWIRRIFIITDNQVPEWLDTSHPKITIVDHKEIMPPEALPCFNSTVLEHFPFTIPDLAEHFLFANDDTCLNRPVTPSTFFAEDGLPYVRLNRRPFRRLTNFLETKILRKSMSVYKKIIHNSAMLVKNKYGKYIGSKTHHNIDAYRKSDCLRVRLMFQKELEPTFANHMRSDQDIHRHIYTYVPMIEKRVHPLYVDQHTSFRFHIDNAGHYEKFHKINPTFFCVNDSEFATPDDRRKVKAFLQELFPDKSSFEK